MPAGVPNCPRRGQPLRRVLDLSYGYWSWEDGAYVQRFAGSGVRVPPFACAECLSGVDGFHPEDPATWLVGAT